MAHDPFAQFPPEPSDEDALLGMDESPAPPFEFEDTSPSLAIILISTACGIGFGVIGMYFAYQLLGLNIQMSAALATLAASVGLGLSGALLSAITGSRAAVANIFFSCGLVIATVVFFGICTIIGAIAATFILSIR